MRLNLALAALPFLLSAQFAFAADDKPKVDFDQGPNASAVLKEAREKSGVSEVRTLHEFRETAPSAKLSKISVPPSLKLAVMAPPPSESPTSACDAYVPENDGRPSGLRSLCPEKEKGEAESCTANQTVRDLLPQFLRDLAVAPGTVFGGPFGPMPQAGAVYREGLGLKNQVQAAPSIPADTRGALLKDWSEIDSIGSGLTNDGNGIDVEDGALYTDAVRINVWADRINARLAILRRLAGDYNQRCRSGPLPPGEVTACNQWADRFNGCVDRHNAAVGRYEQAVAAWNANYDRLEPRVSGFRVQLQNWENLRIKPFIELAKKALAGCDKLVSMRIDPARPPLLPAGGALQDFHATPAFAAPGTNACKVSYLWTTINTSGNIGTLTVSPQTERHATLTTGNDSAEGSVVIEGVDTTGAKASASAPVKVLKGAQQCREEGTQCLPEAGGQFKLVCTYNCCGDTEIGEPIVVPSCLGAKCPLRFCAPK